MYLKSIEVQGFKSFANRIKFDFHNGITGIVGPNGSGKSNVADAVRWVLGEQRSKQLRGSSMQDIIFSGTQTRKPVSYAYVAITLDNSDRKLSVDFDEVTVARRIYRSGESEYLINGTVCRLKDVNEMFYDTGIGKEGYSIIGQGQIDKIISGKPEERRELFDEASGIVKFKRRKNAAIKKLDEESNNLVRVKDIISELEKQVGPLERQSNIAKEYLNKRETLKSLDVNVFLLDNERITDQLEDISGKHSIATSDLENTTIEYNSTKERYQRVSEEIAQLDMVIEKTRNDAANTSVTKGKLEGEINVLREQISSGISNREHFNKRVLSLEEEIDSRRLQMKNILEQKKIMDQEVEAIIISQHQSSERLEDIHVKIAHSNTEIENRKNAIIEGLNNRATIKSKIGSHLTMLEQHNIRKATLNSMIVQAKTDEVEQSMVIEELENKVLHSNALIDDINHNIARTDEELGVLRKDLGDYDKELRDTQVIYHKEKSKLEAISNIVDRYEGYGGAVKRIMENKSEYPGIIGVVADIIKVDKKYEIAIETALGSSIQNVVTKDEKTAKAAIRYLKDNRAGRVTFLPITSTKNSEEYSRPEVLREEGVIGLAHTLVDIDSKYACIANTLLGRIIVVDNVDNALKIAAKYNYRLRIVTIEGELLAPGGSISGGSYKNSSNLLSRRREMEESETKVKESLAKVDELLNKIEATKSKRNSVRIKLEEIKVELQEEFIHLNTHKLNVIKAQEKKYETEQGFESVAREIEEIDNHINQIQSDSVDINTELERSQEAERILEKEISQLQLLVDELRLEEQKVATEVANKDIQVNTATSKQSFGQENINRIEGELNKYLKDLEELNININQNVEDIEDKEKKIEQILITIESSKEYEETANRELSEYIKNKELKSREYKNYFDNIEAINEKKSNLDKEVYRLVAQKEKLSEELSSHINYMWNEYELTLHEAVDIRIEGMTDLRAMKKDIAIIREEIKRLGNVNVNAIEDYRNLMERYSFLKEQYDDLEEAKETLLGIIEELDTAMRKQFNENFELISREYDKIFRELFGGGKGTLELIDEGDVLEAGIRIIAQPPGKKLVNMMQLSGGEKALTAIALLFAIQNLKPSPFCLLDEIEAALDENNVTRFGNYLHKLTRSTQFIVITHRRGTMEKADRLYGITMAEKGVSTLVSVDLISGKLDD